jgi:hypothetical protein
LAFSISEYIAAARRPPASEPGKEIILAADRYTAQGPFGRVVVERQAAIVEVADEGRPASPHIAEGGGQLGFARELVHGGLGPGRQRLGDRGRSLLAFSSSVVGGRAVDRLLDG